MSNNTRQSPRSRLAPCLFALLTLGACGAGDETADDAAKGPNVVLIVLDTLRADALSFYGHDGETAPYLARLAANGTVFRRTWSSSTWTAPATASLVTGVYPDRHGVIQGFLAQFRDNDEPVAEEVLPELELLAIPEDVPTLAEHFQSMGYATFGITANINVGVEMGFTRGFDEFERHDGRPASYLAKRLQKLVPLARDSEPYFLYAHLNDVHKPYELRKRYHLPPEDGADEAAVQRALYTSELGFADGFLEAIHALFGWDDETLICVVADHGEEFQDHGQWFHHLTLYDELARIPFFVHAPGLGVDAGVVEENVSIVDVAPTLLELAGLEPPAGLDGRSLATLALRDADGGEIEEERAALVGRSLVLHRWESGRELWGIVRGAWKLIVSAEGVELYDLRADPKETRNVARANAGVVAELREELDLHRGRGSDPKSLRTKIKIDDYMLLRLKHLGYVSESD